MTSPVLRFPHFPADGSVIEADTVYARALDARDPRFDGVFFVGITTTHIYCRPICPARISHHDRRRFFRSAAAAERAGFRPCRRCRPELAPGRAICDALPRLARAAAERIADGALNGRSVADLARELGVSERHLRRALEQEIGASPLDLAQTHRLLLARRLLADTTLPITRVAYASGFQSLRRFNDAFHAQYGAAPSVVRRPARRPAGRNPASDSSSCQALGSASLRLTLAYRGPLAWEPLLAVLAGDAIPGVDLVAGGRYARTIRIGHHAGVVVVEEPPSTVGWRRRAPTHLVAHVSSSLVPVLMSVLARLRHLLDLDAEPAMIDAHLSQGGLEPLVSRWPGLRVPGAVDGFDIALRVLLGRRAERVVAALGEPLLTHVRGLDRLPPTPASVIDAGSDRLVQLGVHPRQAEALVRVARGIVDGTLQLEPGRSVVAAHRALAAIAGIGPLTATAIVARALDWPDAFATSDRALLARAESWRPWRAYAALYLRLARSNGVSAWHCTAATELRAARLS